MENKPKPQEEEGGEGAPLWIISFADMISLLMAFFVMLSTFSGFGPNESAKLRKVTTAVLSPNFYGGWHNSPPQAGMGRQMVAAGQVEKGSERPTLEEATGRGSLAKTGRDDFRTRKVFLIESKKVFWGSGTTLSTDGRDFLNILATFANKVQDRLVVSESAPGNNSDSAILRAVAVVEYLSGRGISKSRCNVATKNMVSKENLKNERMLEIVLLDEGTYK